MNARLDALERAKQWCAALARSANESIPARRVFEIELHSEDDQMSHYHDSDDLKLLPELKKLAPDEFKGFVALDAIVGKEDGAIPRKYRELIALAVACTTQCPYCLDVHTRNAKRAGATREEVAEVAFLAAALRAGAAVTHGALALKLFDQH
jgi:AhpD family alkylhydroperoxidase